MGKGKELIRGIGGSLGVATGTVRVVYKDPELMGKVTPGDVLVAERLTPDDDIYLKKAAAVVTDTDGILSHAQIVAREWGVPCITGTIKATTVLQNGQKVVVSVTGEKEEGVPIGIVYEYVPEPVAAAGPSLADKMAELMAKKGISNPAFLEKMRRREE